MRRVSVLCALLVALAATGCGSGSSETDSGGAAPKPKGPSSAALRAKLDAATKIEASSFEATGGRTLRQIADGLDGTGPQVSFASQTLVPGPDRRLAFGVIDEKTGFVYAPTAVYLAPAENAKAEGPFPAPADLLVTDPAFASQNAASESDPFAAIYQASVPLRRPGTYYVLAVSLVNGERVGAAGLVKVRGAEDDPVPDIGERAPSVKTDTVASAGGDIKSIDTRVPADDMHDTSLDEALGNKPTALLFATPQLCESRVCGPVVDIAAQLKKTYGDRMTFIHQEVFVDNKPDKGLRPPLKAFRLPTEPWLFVMDSNGVITSRLEGSFGFRAFEDAIKTGLKGTS